MKRTVFILAILALPIVFSCKKENFNEELPQEQKTVSVTSLRVSPGEATKTAFVDGSFMWKTNDNFVVRSNNANGYSTFKYAGESTAGAAQFDINSTQTEDKIVTGNRSFAVYPAKTSGSGADAFPREDEGALKIVLKNSYTWAEGNVEAPMLAKIPEDPTSEALEFKHLGGVLKLTYKNVPPKATKLIVSAPAGEGQCYKICDVMNKTWNWDGAEGGFTGETPYLQAYSVSGTKEITQDISAATADQRVSDDGLVVYVPLPVGPGNTHTYPKIKVRLAFADGTTVPGSECTASNVKIERAVIKKMQPIVLTKYTVETILGTTVKNAIADKVDGGKDVATLGSARGMVWLNDHLMALMDQNASIRVVDFSDPATPVITKTYYSGKVNNAVTSNIPYYAGAPTQTLQSGEAFNAPWSGCLYGGKLWVVDKGQSRLLSVDYEADGTMTKVSLGRGFYNIFNTGGNKSPMGVVFDADGNAYVPVRDLYKIYKLPAGFNQSTNPTEWADLSSFSAQVDAVIFDRDGNMIVSTNSTYKLYLVQPDGTVTALGKGTQASDFSSLVDGKISNATFPASMYGMVFDEDGALYLASRYWLRRITPGENGWLDATVTTVLGGNGTTLTEGVGAMAGFKGIDYLSFRPGDYTKLYLTHSASGRLLSVSIE